MTKFQTMAHSMVGLCLLTSPALGAMIMAKAGHPKYVGTLTLTLTLTYTLTLTHTPHTPLP
jgi:hypothetical protein